MPLSISASVATGRMSFVDGTTLVYVPWKSSRADLVVALREIYRKGVLRPVPGTTDRTERVYPMEWCPTEDPTVYYVNMRNDDGELIEVTAHVHYRGRNDAAIDMLSREPNELLDPTTAGYGSYPSDV